MRTEIADLIIVNGNIVTLSPERPEATALAVQEGRIVAVGGDGEVTPLRGPLTRLVDLRGRSLWPGLGDAHLHLVYYGMTSGWLAFQDCRNVGEVLALVRQRAVHTPAGMWIYGRGWDPNTLAERRGPTLPEMDSAAPGHPVLLARRDGHLCVANSRALAEAGIREDTPSPTGGVIARDAAGQPTGELLEAAIYLAWNRMMDALTVQDFIDAALEAGRDAARSGLTSAHCILLENIPTETEALYRLDAEGKLPLRCYLVPSVESLETLPPDYLGKAGRRVRLGGAKIFADGTFIGHTAALREPYADDPTSRGHMNYPPEVLRDLVSRVKDKGLQPLIHAVGDATVEACLDAFESVLGPDTARWRPRIEHAAVVGPDLAERMARIGAVASIQARRRARMEAYLGPERTARAITPKSLLDAGVHVAGGTDAPFVQTRLAPLEALGAIVEESRMAVEDVWRLFSQGVAYAAFAENERGTLRTGMQADFVVLGEDPRRVRPEEVASLPVRMTVCDGEVVWEDTA